MGTTYLELTNRVLRKLNQVELTTLTFSTATGFHALCKDLVQEAIDKINQESLRWPFNHVDATLTLVADTNRYVIPTASRIVDWNSFFMEEDAALEVSAKPIPHIDYMEWHNRFRGSEQLATSGSVNYPSQVYRTRDEEIGISPIPGRAYTISY